ncbi:helix-turn-helix domain-containing protein [Pseudoluteimonas lycopersici]|uniref:Helix-turn-helix domain-containing protein n=1 Tax=Pseudoluteimonas lycopersici TaxID=1324796 RepID=A0A516V3R7_9GAMM|nr:helix-turn-helix domain-containing protein [Lysobacter lycopersici]
MSINTESKLPRTLTTEQIAILLALTVTTVRTYATAKRYRHLLPRHFKLPGGRRLLWDEDEVLEWMRSGRIATLPRPPKKRGRPSKRQQFESADATAQAKEGRSLNSLRWYR